MGFTIRMKIDNGDEKKYKLQTAASNVSEESDEEVEENGSDDQDAN